MQISRLIRTVVQSKEELNKDGTKENDTDLSAYRKYFNEIVNQRAETYSRRVISQ